MSIPKNTEITLDIARAINALSDEDKQTVVDRLTIKQTQALFIVLLYQTL